MGGVIWIGAFVLVLGCTERSVGNAGAGGLGGIGGLGGGRGETPKLGWCTPERVEMGDTEHPRELQLAADAHGNVIALWQDWLGGLDVWSTSWTSSQGWATAERIPRENGPASRPRFAFDMNGDAVAVWPQSDCEGSNDVLSSRWTLEDGWAPHDRIDSADGPALDPELAIDFSGNVFAAWQQYDVWDISVWANRWTEEQGWGSAQLLATSVEQDSELRVAADGSGRAVVTWTKPDAEENARLWLSSWTPEGGWGTPELADEPVSVRSYDIASLPSGHMLLVWSDRNDHSLKSARWFGAWEPAEEVTAHLGRDLDVSVDEGGNAFAIWRTGTYDSRALWAARWAPGEGWQAQEMIRIPEGGASVGGAQLAVERDGDAIVVWAERGDASRTDVRSRRWISDEGWQEAELISRGDGWRGHPRVVFDATGTPHALWSKAELGTTTEKLWSSRYELGCGSDEANGAGGVGGQGGAGTGEADLCAGIACPDTECKSGGQCDSSSGTCVYSTVAGDGAACSEGECLAGGCGRVGSFACTEQGLKDAIAAGGGPHFFACDEESPIVLEEGLRVDNDVALDGEGQLVIDRQGKWDSVLHVEVDRSVLLDGIQVIGGSSHAVSGVFSEGNLVVVNSIVQGINNYSGNLEIVDTEVRGSGVDNHLTGTATLTRCRVVSLDELSPSEGIHNDHDASMTVTDSLITGWGIGEWPLYSGAVVNWGDLTIENTTISGNHGIEAGAIFHQIGTLTLLNSTVADNIAERGPSIFVTSRGELTLVNSTVSGATSGFDCNAYRNGYAIGSTGTVTITNSTLAGNSFGALNNWGDATVTNSVLDGGCVQLGDDSTLSSGGHNIIGGSDACGFDDPTDMVGVSSSALALGPLADNGGPTMTYSLMPESVAIDVIPELACEVDEDQRGEPRPAGGMCDIGAFEVQP